LNKHSILLRLFVFSKVGIFNLGKTHLIQPLRAIRIICLIAAASAISKVALAQSLPSSDASSAPVGAASGGGSGDSSESDLEDIYDKADTKAEKSGANKPQSPVSSRKAEVEAQNLSDLAKLAPFSDIAVIQRRFLPKTKRFELSASGFTNLNNPFYTSYGLGLEASYYLREQWAVEALGQFSTTGARQVTDDLRTGPPKITTDNLVTSKGFYGGGIKWNPIYGKITWLNKTIVPFDLNFNLAFGMTQTTANTNEPTVHIGTSQVFAYTKAVAFRWDISWNTYQATVKDTDGTKKLTQNDLFLGLGVSFYFPEATYR
jgi:outer membrane beta-barrel protein